MVKKTQRINLVDLKAQFKSISREMEEAILRVVHSSYFIGGSEVDAFEAAFARFCGTEYCIGVASGTDALRLALQACGIDKGDEVVTVPNTFVATTEAISLAGGTPVFVDVATDTYTMDPQKLEELITYRMNHSKPVKAIIPVHLYGHPAQMDALLDLAARHNFKVIEDACQAHGAKYKGTLAGSMGNAAAFSFYPGKNLGAYGDGGMVVTNDAKIADKLKLLRDYGQKEKYHHLIKGYNRRLDTLQAVVLRIKLNYVKEWNESRRRHALRYNELLQDSQATLPVNADFAESVYHLYVIRVPNRNEMLSFLQQNGISVGIHYPIPIHLQPAYMDLGYQKGDFPVTERYADEILSLPMFPELNDDQITYITNVLMEFR